MVYNTASTDLKFLLFSTTDWLILFTVSIIIAVATFVAYRFYNEEVDKNSRSVMIKIDRNGKHRYEIKEDLDNSKMLFWIKVVFFIIALALFCIPIHNWFYKS